MSLAKPHPIFTTCDIVHLLVLCPALEDKRAIVKNHWQLQTQNNPHLNQLFTNKLASSPTEFVQFVLDPSAVNEVITGCQNKQFSLDQIFPLCRTWVYAAHRRRLQLLGRFNSQ